MKVIADYHTHTKYSRGHLLISTRHAEGEIEQHVQEAIAKGLKTLGISDHGFGHFLFGLRKKDLREIRDEVDRLNKKYQEIDILLGVECNILDTMGRIDMPEDLKPMFDYINAGYHFASDVVNFSGLKTHMSNLLLKNEFCKKRNTQTIINAMENNNIFYITHPGDKGMVDIVEVAKAAVANNTGLEINGGHKRLNSNDLKLIEHLRPDLYIGSDAHKSSMVGELDKGIKIALDSGIDLGLIKNIKID